MSGIEIAGIALAVIPIAITAIQEYRKICEPFLIISRPSVKYVEMAELYQTIHYEITRLQLIMQRLSRELYVPWVTEKELQAIISPEALQKWEWRDAAMRHRLNSATDAFGESTQGLLKVLEELTKDDTLKLQAEEIVMRSSTKQLLHIS
jgi:hypothetical protein